MRGTFSGIEAPVHVILPRARRSPEQLLLVLLSLSLSLSLSLYLLYPLPTIPDRSLILKVIRAWSAILGLVLFPVRRSNALVSLANEDDPM